MGNIFSNKVENTEFIQDRKRHLEDFNLDEDNNIAKRRKIDCEVKDSSVPSIKSRLADFFKLKLKNKVPPNHSSFDNHLVFFPYPTSNNADDRNRIKHDVLNHVKESKHLKLNDSHAWRYDDNEDYVTINPNRNPAIAIDLPSAKQNNKLNSNITSEDEQFFTDDEDSVDGDIQPSTSFYQHKISKDYSNTNNVSHAGVGFNRCNGSPKGNEVVIIDSDDDDVVIIEDKTKENKNYGFNYSSGSNRSILTVNLNEKNDSYEEEEEVTIVEDYSFSPPRTLHIDVIGDQFNDSFLSSHLEPSTSRSNLLKLPLLHINPSNTHLKPDADVRRHQNSYDSRKCINLDEKQRYGALLRDQNVSQLSSIYSTSPRNPIHCDYKHRSPVKNENFHSISNDINSNIGELRYCRDNLDRQFYDARQLLKDINSTEQNVSPSHSRQNFLLDDFKSNSLSSSGINMDYLSSIYSGSKLSNKGMPSNSAINKTKCRIFKMPSPLLSLENMNDITSLNDRFSIQEPTDLCKDINEKLRLNQINRKSNVDILEKTLGVYNENRRKWLFSEEEELKRRMRFEGIVIAEKEIEEIDFYPELSQQQNSFIDSVLNSGSQNDIIVESFKIPIKRSDLRTLQGLNWLNDEVINFYCSLLVERSENSDEFPSLYAFNTFFYPKLIKTGYDSLRRWTRNVDIFNFDILIIPVHLGVHWCLAVIDFRRRYICYYDSMGGENDRCLQALANYLEKESLDKRKSKFDSSSMQLLNVTNVPQQMNGSDCGVFTCQFAACIAADRRIGFTQADMPYFRRRMVFEIAAKLLL